MTTAIKEYSATEAALAKLTESVSTNVSLDNFQDIDSIRLAAKENKQSIDGLLITARAACQYLEADPKSRNHIVTTNLRASLNRVL